MRVVDYHQKVAKACYLLQSNATTKKLWLLPTPPADVNHEHINRTCFKQNLWCTWSYGRRWVRRHHSCHIILGLSIWTVGQGRFNAKRVKTILWTLKFIFICIIAYTTVSSEQKCGVRAHSLPSNHSCQWHSLDLSVLIRQTAHKILRYLQSCLSRYAAVIIDLSYEYV